MNITRGLFRLWLVLSGLWSIGFLMILAVDKNKHPDAGLWAFWVVMFLASLIPPALILALGSVLLWAFRGFQKQPK
jgi:hypothetical protein